ncbi:hypothetical protein ACFL4W_03130 [Planctomycetota bacterium]
MYEFRLRPGYGNDKLLIEFLTDADEPGFLDALRGVIQKAGFSLKESTGLLALANLGGTTYKLKGPHGVLTLDVDEYGLTFIMGEGNQEGIKYLGQLFEDNEAFEKQDVDFSEFT